MALFYKESKCWWPVRPTVGFRLFGLFGLFNLFGFIINRNGDVHLGHDSLELVHDGAVALNAAHHEDELADVALVGVEAMLGDDLVVGEEEGVCGESRAGSEVFGEDDLGAYDDVVDEGDICEQC